MPIVTNYSTIATASWTTQLSNLLSLVSSDADKRSALAWMADGTNGLTRRSAFEGAYSAGILDHLSVWSGDNSILEALTNYSTLTTTIDLSDVDNTQKVNSIIGIIQRQSLTLGLRFESAFVL